MSSRGSIIDQIADYNRKGTLESMSVFRERAVGFEHVDFGAMTVGLAPGPMPGRSPAATAAVSRACAACVSSSGKGMA